MALISFKRILILIAFLSTILFVKAISSKDNDLITKIVTFDISIGGEPIGKIKMGLFGKMNPKTVENFATFAGPGYNGKKYEGSTFHRVIKDFMIQGGDMIRGDGTGSISIYDSKFDDEFPAHDHTVSGLLSMANSGPNTNGCQFFITTQPTPWLDHKHVVFGKVLDKDSMKVVRTIESTQTDSRDKPVRQVKITKSVVENVEKPYISKLVEL